MRERFDTGRTATWGLLMILVSGLVTAGAVRAASADDAKMNVRLEPDDAAAVESRGARVLPITPPAKDSPSLRIVFEAGPQYPNARFSPVAGATWDWGKFGAMVMRVRNPGADPAAFSLRIDDDPDTQSGTVHCKTGSATEAPGATGTFVLNLAAGGDPMKQHGMRGGPPALTLPGAVELSGSGSVEPGHVTSFQIFMDRPAKEQSLIIESIRLVQTPNAADSYDRIVDRFGQYAKTDWPNKIHNDAELDAARDAETNDLEANPVLPDRDAYGGWLAGPGFPPTGFFTTRNVDGRWWLVDPEGRLFFSVGINTVTFTESGTVVTGREPMFESLPAPGDPLARFYRPLGRIHSGPVSSGRTFSFYAANLCRRYGTDFKSQWDRTAIARFKSWGINTLGNWSDERLEQLHGIPFTASLGIRGNHRRVSGGEDYWGLMHDPFDPAFAADAERSFGELAFRIRDDPWCVGYFPDNELSWGGGPGPEEGRYNIAYGTLREGPDSPAKQAFVAQLKGKYGAIESLAEAWNNEIRSWDAIAAPYKPPPGEPSAAMKEDLATFVTAFARQYFTVVRDALRKHDPNHLYLGCRFAYFTPEEAKAAAEACDVVSFNVYATELSKARWAFAEDLGKPCLIGEFHVGSTDRGMFHPGLIAAASQQERAAIFKRYVESVADHPAFVGCHWFDYIDEPLTGRWFDGENYSIGFVTVTDTPYPEMVAAAREVNRQIYRRRAKGEARKIP